MVGIDQGNGPDPARRAKQQLNVKAGNLVVSGQRVASAGSTGRSTGPHLDVEVRLNGVPQDRARFLRATA